MRTTVEIEYVGIEDIQEITDDAYALMRAGHYVSLEVHNITTDNVRVNIMIMLDGWVAGEAYDYDFDFYVSDKEDDVCSMNECKSVLKNLILEE